MTMRAFGAALLVLWAAPAAAQGPRLYVANQDDATVSVVDLKSQKLLEKIDLQKLGFGPNAKPHHAQVDPDGAHWYLTAIGAGKVFKFDRNDKIVGSVDLEVPGLLTIVPGKDLLIVGRSMSAVNPPKRIALIRRSDMKLLDEVDVFFPRPHALVAHPKGEYVFVASLGVNQFASIRLADGQSELVDFDGPPQTFTQFAVSPDGHWLAATGQQGNQVVVYDVSNPAKPVLARTIPMEKGPFEPVFTYDGTRLLVTNLDANKVSFVDTATWDVVKVIESPQFAQPHGVALSPDGKYLWVTNRHQAGGAHDHEGHKAVATGTAMAICIPTGDIETVIESGNYAAGMGVAVPAKAPKTPASCH
ncbi:MAG: YncE family protein [Gemmatimonadales bacterium]